MGGAAEGCCIAVDGRAADQPGKERRGGLPPHRGGAADLPSLAAAVRWNAGRGGQAAEPAGSGERSALAAGCEAIEPR